MLRSPDSFIRLSIMALQQSPDILSYESSQQDAKESGYLDTGGVQNIAARRTWSVGWTYPSQIPSSKNR